MNFEIALTYLKSGGKVIRSGWNGAEKYIKIVKESVHDGEILNPYFVINVEGEGYTVFTPTVCDLLAEDWEKVEIY